MDFATHKFFIDGAFRRDNAIANLLLMAEDLADRTRDSPGSPRPPALYIPITVFHLIAELHARSQFDIFSSLAGPTFAC